MPARPPRRKQILPKTPDILTVPTFSTISLIDTMPLSVNQPIDVLPNVFDLNLNDYSADESIPEISTKIQELPHMNQMVNQILFMKRNSLN